eukprot:scaffold9689_cov116-Isochrysis_galbana.AAC.4
MVRLMGIEFMRTKRANNGLSILDDKWDVAIRDSVYCQCESVFVVPCVCVCVCVCLQVTRLVRCAPILRPSEFYFIFFLPAARSKFFTFHPTAPIRCGTSPNQCTTLTLLLVTAVLRPRPPPPLGRRAVPSWCCCACAQSQSFRLLRPARAPGRVPLGQLA